MHRYSADRMRGLYADRVLRAVEDEAAEAGQPGELLQVRNVRARTRLGKRAFDRAMLDLRDLGRVVLHHHDAPDHVDAATRAKWVHDSKGNTGWGTSGIYYVGVAIR